MLDNIVQILWLVLICIVLLFGAFVIFFILFRKRRAAAAMQEDDYGGVPVEDSVDLVPIDDIRDNMVIDENGTRFSAALICTGKDFFYESVEEKVRMQDNYIHFWQSQRSPVSFRQSSENINLDHTIELYENAHKSVEQQYYNLSLDYTEMREKYSQAEAAGDPSVPQIEQMLLKMQKQLKSLEFRLIHIEDELRLANRMSGPSADNQKSILMYVFSWYQPGGIMGEGLSGDALYARAIEELDKICNDNIKILADCGVIAKRATTEELIDQFRKQTHPVTGNSFRTSDLFKFTAWNDDVVTTDSFDKAKDRFMNDLTQEMFIGGRNGTVQK